MSKNQDGFSIVEGLLLLVIVGLIGFIGWYVWHAKQNTDKNLKVSDSSTPIKPGTAIKPVFSKLPTDFNEYKNDTYGLRMGYPSVAGTMVENMGTGTIFQASTPRLYDADKNLDGGYQLRIYDKNTFTFDTAKYGATIKPEGNKWVITAVNPADTEYKVGDQYKMTQKKINGGVAYEFTDNEEGYPTVQWIIELGKGYVVVAIPRLTTHDIMTNDVTPANRQAYAELKSEVLASFTRF